MTNQHELNDRQISILVKSYNSWKDESDEKMSDNDFEQDEPDFAFWGPALLGIFTTLVRYRLKPNEKISFGRLKLNRDQLLKDFWSIAVIMTNDLGIADEIVDKRVTSPFQRIADEVVPMPEKNYVAESHLFKLAMHCSERAR